MALTKDQGKELFLMNKLIEALGHEEIIRRINIEFAILGISFRFSQEEKETARRILNTLRERWKAEEVG